MALKMYKLSNKEYLQMIGRRIKLYRVYSGISQKELEEKTGISIRTISRLEAGISIQLDGFIRILKALDLDGNIELIVPDQSKRPLMYLEKSSTKQRVYGKKVKQEEFKWGDEE